MLFVEHESRWENGVRKEYGKRADGTWVYLYDSYRPSPQPERPIPQKDPGDA